LPNTDYELPIYCLRVSITYPKSTSFDHTNNNTNAAASPRCILLGLWCPNTQYYEKLLWAYWIMSKYSPTFYYKRFFDFLFINLRFENGYFMNSVNDVTIRYQYDRILLKNLKIIVSRSVYCIMKPTDNINVCDNKRK